MIKPRLRAIERRLAQHRRPPARSLRVVTIRAGDPEPHAAPGEDLIIIERVNTHAQDAARGGRNA